VRLSLLPRERKFYDLFERDIANILVGAQTLVELLTAPQPFQDPADKKRIKDIEHQGDELTHEIIRTLNQTFVTPFDREDIYALVTALDDVLDYIEDVAEIVGLYDVRAIPEPVHQQARLLVQALEQLAQAIDKLEGQKGLETYWVEVNRIEDEGDQALRAAVGELFRTSKDPMEVMKLKELYEVLEDALDRCEDVANVIENIVIKNA
jgi:predicted phosphate transport protein (TIGR00153 family)